MPVPGLRYGKFLIVKTQNPLCRNGSQVQKIPIGSLFPVLLTELLAFFFVLSKKGLTSSLSRPCSIVS